MTGTKKPEFYKASIFTQVISGVISFNQVPTFFKLLEKLILKILQKKAHELPRYSWEWSSKWELSLIRYQYYCKGQLQQCGIGTGNFKRKFDQLEQTRQPRNRLLDTCRYDLWSRIAKHYQREWATSQIHLVHLEIGHSENNKSKINAYSVTQYL